jgi:hypothetical protein
VPLSRRCAQAPRWLMPMNTCVSSRSFKTRDYAPFMTAEESGPAGIYAEIIKEADKRLPGYTIELTSAPWTRAKFLVQSGKVNGLVGTYHKPIRRPWIRHFSTPMAKETIYVYCREGVAQDHWDYPKDYAGLLFSNNAGFATPGSAFFEMVSAGKIQLIEEQTTDANLRLCSSAGPIVMCNSKRLSRSPSSPTTSTRSYRSGKSKRKPPILGTASTGARRTAIPSLPTWTVF